MVLLFLGGLLIGVLAVTVMLTAGLVAEFLHWQNELIFHRR